MIYKKIKNEKMKMNYKKMIYIWYKSDGNIFQNERLNLKPSKIVNLVD